MILPYLFLWVIQISLTVSGRPVHVRREYSQGTNTIVHQKWCPLLVANQPHIMCATLHNLQPLCHISCGAEQSHKIFFEDWIASVIHQPHDHSVTHLPSSIAQVSPPWARSHIKKAGPPGIHEDVQNLHMNSCEGLLYSQVSRPTLACCKSYYVNTCAILKKLHVAGPKSLSWSNRTLTVLDPPSSTAFCYATTTSCREGLLL